MVEPSAVSSAKHQLPTPSTTMLHQEEEEDYFLPMDDSVAEEEEEEPPVRVVKYQSTAAASCLQTCTSNLDVIQEQPAPTDVAVAILEGFFFGTINTTSRRSGSSSCSTNPLSEPGKQQQQRQMSQKRRNSMESGTPSTTKSRWLPAAISHDENSLGSPKSIIIPVCSCTPEQQRLFFVGLHNTNMHSTTPTSNAPLSGRTQSMPMMVMPRRSSICSVGSLSTTGSPKPVKSVLKQAPQRKERSNSVNNLGKQHRNVSFTEISVREYDVELSDHPSCSYGPPIQLGWDYQEKETVPLEDYEVTRSPHRRQNVHDLVLSYNARKRRLKQCGYKKQEIQAVEKEVDRIKRERMITEFFLPASAIDESLERFFGFLKETIVQLGQPKKSCEASSVCQVHSPPMYATTSPQWT